MNDITPTQKLQLIQQIRSQYHRNQNDMYRREQILYGNRHLPSSDEYSHSDTVGKISGFKIRSMVAIVFVCSVILSDLYSFPTTSKNAGAFLNAMKMDYQDLVAEWIRVFPEESKNKQTGF